MRTIVSFILCLFAGSISAAKSIGTNPWLFESPGESKLQYVNHHEILAPIQMIMSRRVAKTRDLVILFRNDGDYQIRTQQGVATIDGKDYRGAVYGKTSLGFELGYPVRAKHQGVIVIKIVGDSKWQQCSLHQVKIKGLNNLELQPLFVVPFVAKAFSSANTSLWLRYVEYASNCSHIELRDRQKQ